VLRGDPARLRQVFDNLLANAAIHTPAGTPVTVSVSIEDEHGNDDAVLVRVIDEGEGIAPENTERIFDRFFRVDDSRNRRNGGSRPGRTAFTVRLPLVHVPSGPPLWRSTPQGWP
jgi:two-component system, OmpR family, sensor kinase